jgi:hypothetical protein
MKRSLIDIMITISLAAVLMLGCARQVVLAEAVTKGYNFTDFNRIEVGRTNEFLNWWNTGSHFEIEVNQSSTYKIDITANENILEFINVSQSGDTLKIVINRPKIGTDRAVMKAQISLPDLHGINLSGESIGVVRGFDSNQEFAAQVSGVSSLDLDMKASAAMLSISSSCRAAVRGSFSKFDAEVSGASNLDTDIQTENAGLRVSSSSHVTHKGTSRDFKVVLSGASTLDIDARTGITALELESSSRMAGKLNSDDLELQLSGASHIQLEGSGGNANLRASSSSNMNMPGFTLKDAQITLSGASRGDINVNGRMDVNLSSASSLQYGGNPSLGDIEVTGASTINRK